MSPASTRRADERSRSGAESDSFVLELLFRSGRAQANCSGGDRLIVLADLVSGGESVFADPAFDQP